MPIERPTATHGQQRSTDTCRITVANSTTVSAALDLMGNTALALITPAVLTSTTIQFQVSVDGTNYFPLYDRSNNRVTVSVPTGAAQAYPLDPTIMLPWRFIKVEAASAEAADRLFTIVAGIV